MEAVYLRNFLAVCVAVVSDGVFVMPELLPCPYPKHSIEQLDWLRQRAELELPLFHPHDCRRVVVCRKTLDEICNVIRLEHECRMAANQAEADRLAKKKRRVKPKARHGGKILPK